MPAPTYKDLINLHGRAHVVRGLAAFVRIMYSHDHAASVDTVERFLPRKEYTTVPRDIARCIRTRAWASRKLDKL